MAKSPGFQCPDDGAKWSEWLAVGLHACHRWRLPGLIVGMLFANGLPAVAAPPPAWLRGAEPV